MNRVLAYLAITVLCSTMDIGAQTDVSKAKPQELPQGQEIKVRTELMEVRAVVTDKKGRIIEGLTRDDFELLENDRPQEISFFSVSEVEGQRNRPAAAAAKLQDKAAEGQTTQERLSSPPVRTTLLFVDNLHLSFTSLNWVKQALRRFIKERLTERDVVAVAASSQTLGVAQQFTRDQQLLNYAIEKISLGPTRIDSYFTPVLASDVVSDRRDALRQAVDIIRRDEGIACPCSAVVARARAKAMQILSEDSYSRRATLSVLREYAEQMIGSPGKRMIVVLSDGFTMRELTGGLYSSDLQQVVDRAVRSGVVVYTIDAKGLQAPPTIDAGKRWFWPNANEDHPFRGMDPQEIRQKANENSKEVGGILDGKACPGELIPDERCLVPQDGLLASTINLSVSEQLNGLHAMAEETGGKMYTNTNDLFGSLGQAFDANRFYYVLSYYLQPGGNDSQFRSVKVRVRNHPEYTVQHPRGFLPLDTIAKPETDAAKTPQQRLIQAMGAPLPATDLGISAQAEFLVTEADDKQVSLIACFDGDRIQYREQDQRHVFGLEILYLVYDSLGKQVEGISTNVEANLTPERLTQARTSGYRFSRRLTLSPGVYQVRVGVREEGSDRMGTATAWVQVPDIAREKLEMSSLMLRNPLDTDPAAKEGVDVSELEQIKMVRGIPLYERDDFCDYSFRVHLDTSIPQNAELAWMSELLRGGKPVKQEPWVPIPSEERELDSKGWFDVDGEVDLSGLDPGVYELRVSVKETQSSKRAQRTAVFSVE